MILAQLRWDDDGPRTANLTERGWTCAERGTQRVLNAMLASEERSPGVGNWALTHCRAVAQMLGASLHLPKQSPVPEGRVY